MDTIRRCLNLLNAPARKQLALLGALIAVNTALEVISLGMILPFIGLLNNPELVQTNTTINFIYNALDMQSPHTFLALVGFVLLILIIIKNIYLYFVTKMEYRFAFHQAARISSQLFDRYLRAPFETHLVRNSSELITTADYSVDLVFSSVIMSILIMTTEASVVIGILGLMLVAEPILTGILLAILATCGLGLIRAMHHRLLSLGEAGLKLRLARLRSLNQALFSIKELRAFGRESFFGNQFQNIREGHAANQAEISTLTQIPRMVIEAVVVGGLVLVILIILLQGRATGDVISVLGLFAMAAFRIMPGINRLVVGFNAIKNGKAAVDEVYSDLNDPKLEPVLERRGSDGQIAFHDVITLNDVSFRYREAPAPALKHVTLSVKRGESVGFVGVSGAGKSTLIDLVMGLLAPTSGEILVDGHDVASDPAPWRRLIGYVPQAISLIDDTMRNNVAFGVEADQIDDGRVWTTLTMARLGERCRAMPDGLDTMLGERGVRLSGGERQRVGIARALYHDPEVLIFDEATSSLDNESEHEITKAIEALHGQKTLIVIAHRLSTVKSCDRLVFMRNGCIVSVGTFEELCRASAEFRQIVQLAELSSHSSEMTAALK